ncbi:MAG: bifunctional diaminohydroxyphosphoribosylaminopyrimidine deaminase/5-amino-6-(5-phosphoribosylamino)uracil reductase RibD [Raineya sp.]|nr:bifunctional diaminohydroxyphosphoribosylaminopyrimidine deaminase/5-amino-6-(5-phosphoribosylamino)uracil reductase RibD [Raineya sp.]
MNDTDLMHRVLQLAMLGTGSVAPNPLVGSVITYQNKIIGEGWHKEYGKAHAEVNAIASVKEPELLAESTLYVNLEPCSHFGKTPPCANLIVEKKIPRVVIANIDSNPLVAGKGIQILQNAGIQVKTGVLEQEARYLNRRFFTFMEKKRPYIVLKWAETADGFIARKDFSSKWISNEHSRTLVHKWRSEEQAILVGTNTAIYDNPQLNVRHWSGRNPIRIVIDKNLKIPPTHHIFDASQLTICYNLYKNENLPNLYFIRLDKDFFWENLLQDLFERKIQSVLVEGGTKLLQSFIDKNLWDEARVFVAKQHFGEGIAAPQLLQKPISMQDWQGDKLFFYENHQFFVEK